MNSPSTLLEELSLLTCPASGAVSRTRGMATERWRRHGAFSGTKVSGDVIFARAEALPLGPWLGRSSTSSGPTPLVRNRFASLRQLPTEAHQLFFIHGWVILYSQSGTGFVKSLKPAEENAARLQPRRDDKKHRQPMTSQSVATLREGG